MATTDEVQDAVERLNAMFGDLDDATRRKIPDETVGVYVKDLDVAYGLSLIHISEPTRPY